MLYTSPSVHRERQGPKHGAVTGNASEEVLKKLHALLQEQAALPGEEFETCKIETESRLFWSSCLLHYLSLPQGLFVGHPVGFRTHSYSHCMSACQLCLKMEGLTPVQSCNIHWRDLKLLLQDQKEQRGAKPCCSHQELRYQHCWTRRASADYSKWGANMCRHVPAVGDHARPAVLAGALSRALCLINKAQLASAGGSRTRKQPRLLCLKGSPDATEQYISVMNAIFAAQVHRANVILSPSSFLRRTVEELVGIKHIANNCLLGCYSNAGSQQEGVISLRGGKLRMLWIETGRDAVQSVVFTEY